MPSITIECEACNSKSLYIIPFVIRRGGFEHSKILKRNEYGNLKDYLLFIELLLMGESNPIKEFLDGLILFSNNEVIYRTKQSPFYKDTNWYNESARGLAKKIINSILERVINEKRIELNEVNETLLHKKTIGNLKLNFHEAVLRNSEGNDYGVSSQQSELEKISSGIWLFADKYYRTYDLILERNNTTSEIDILEFTILNTSITGNLSTSLAVAQKYIETVERFDISNEGWSQIANLRQSLETFDQVFNVNQTNPTLSHLYDKTMKKLGIDDLERNVKEKFKNIEYHVQSKGQLLINNNLYLLTAGLMSLGLIEILLSWIHLFLLGFRLVEFLSVILAGMGFLVFSVTIYLIFKQNKH